MDRKEVSVTRSEWTRSRVYFAFPTNTWENDMNNRFGIFHHRGLRTMFSTHDLVALKGYGGWVDIGDLPRQYKFYSRGIINCNVY